MIDPEIILKDCKNISAETKRKVDFFISPGSRGRRFLFDRNEHSQALSGVIDIDAFIDDFAIQGSTWLGKPVINGDAVPGDAVVVNCVMCNKPIGAERRIKEFQISAILTFSDFFNALPDLVTEPGFVKESRIDVDINFDKWKQLSEAFADDKSRQILDDLLMYRLSGNFSSMTSYSYRPYDQYFEDFLKLTSDEVFVDAGGFDGDTSELFIRRYPDYKQIYLFEPSLINIEKAQKRLTGFRNVEFIQLGLSDVEGNLWFNPDNGSASSIGETGSCRIDVTTLDSYIKNKITFLKMDLEGWESKALLGASKHIFEDYPKLAIAVYHHPRDFRLIYDYIMSLRSDYTVYLRHYTEGWSETIMYFVPIQ